MSRQRFLNRLAAPLRRWRRGPETTPAEMKGARAEILSCSSHQTVDDAGLPEELLWVEALIHPASRETAWEAGELRLVPAADGSAEGEARCRIVSAQVVEARRFRTAERQGCVGTRRVRFRARLQPGLAELCFRYGGTDFGQFCARAAA